MKKNLFYLVLVFAFALVGCIKNAPESSDVVVKDGEVVVDDNMAQENAPEPTGDVEKDGKAVADYIINKALKINSVKDYEKVVEILDKIDDQFGNYYSIQGTEAEDRFWNYYQYYSKYHPRGEEALKIMEKFNEKARLDLGLDPDSDE